MERERWQQVERLFQAALALYPADRASFLDHACKDDHALRLEVESLINSHDSARSFISSPAIEANASLIANDTSDSILQRKIGPYLILSQIGAGGMGEVYLAQDTRLGRKVALKLLPEYFTRDEQRVRRFKQEARAASALNHPGTITIHDIGEEGGRHFIATEFVDGETLRQMMARGRMNIRESLEIAVQVASALAFAHQAGIVHRDIKPENIMLRPDGLVKVLDFGLAKLTEGHAIATSTQAPTIAKMDTDPGTVMGTAHYMSPEQARGQPVDARTDIFSLGVVIYEMIAGEPPFAGETTADVIVALLNSEPEPLSSLVAQSSSGIEKVAKKALAKDREERYQTAGELLLDLQAVKQEIEQQAQMGRSSRLDSPDSTKAFDKKTLGAITIEPRAATRQTRPWIPGLGVVTAGVLLAAIIVVVWQSIHRPQEQSQSGQRPDLRISQLINMKSDPGGAISEVASSPDGKLLAFASIGEQENSIWIKQVDGGEPRKIISGQWKDRSLIWSPDGQRLAFISDRGGTLGIWSIPYLGGTPTLLKTVDLVEGGLTAWSKKSHGIYYEMNNNLYLLDLASGQTIQLTHFDPAYSSALGFRLPPGEDKIAFSDLVDAKFHILVMPLEGGKPTPITNGEGNDVHPAWFPDGERIVYCSNRTGISQLWLAHTDGREPVQITFSDSNNESPEVLPDGKIIFTAPKENANLFSSHIHSGEEIEHTSSFALQLWPDVSPDGLKVAFQSSNAAIKRSSIFIKPHDSSSPPVQIASDGYDVKWSPGGDTLAFLRASDNRYDIWVVSAGGRDEKQLTTGGILVGGTTGMPYNRTLANYSWSPDGSKIAYCSAKSGQLNLWVISRDGSSDTMVSTNMDRDLEISSPLWSPDGSRIACVSRTLPRSASEKIMRRVCVMEEGKTKTVLQHDALLRLIGWSASGKEIYVAQTEGKAHTPPLEIRLLRVSADGEKSETIARLPSVYLHNIKMSADSQSIALVSRQDGKDNIKLVPISGAPTKQITRNFDPTLYYSGLSWSPDGKTLFYSKQTGWTVISMIENFR